MLVALLIVVVIAVMGLLAAAIAEGSGATAVVIMVGMASAGSLGWYFVDRPNAIRCRRLANGLCGKCGCDLRGNVTGLCPECGHACSTS